MSEDGEREMLAQELSRLAETISLLEQRVHDVETVNARLEVAALTTARSMQEISSRWDAVYEVMRRVEKAEE